MNQFIYDFIQQEKDQQLENSRIMSTAAIKVASKYMLGPKIGSGSFGEVFAVNMIGTTEIFALKREDEKSKTSQIIVQCKILKQMNNAVGFAKVHWHGTENKFNIMVMDMLGPSLQDLFQICGKTFSLKTTIMIIDQMIQRIQELHNQNYLHRDIKPQNFLMGINKNSHIVHLIDFGLSKKYRDSKTMQHIPYKQNKNLTGTARYASINAHLGIEQSRRDDLQAIGYVMLYFLQGFLPWQGIKANNKNEKYQKIMEKKMSIPIEVQCKGLPLQISTFLCYCRSLKFNDKPDYSFLRRTLRDLFVREGFKFDYCYDWTQLKQDQKLDNGKVRLQIKSRNLQPNNLNQSRQYIKSSAIKIEQPVNSPQQLQKSNNSVKATNKEWNEDKDKDKLLIGQQNIDDNEIGQEDEDIEKKVDLLIDMEEKRYQLYQGQSNEFYD